MVKTPEVDYKWIRNKSAVKVVVANTLFKDREQEKLSGIKNES